MTRSFVSPRDRTFAYEEAISAIAALIKETGVGAVERAYAEATCDRYVEFYVRRRDGVRLKKTRGASCLHRLTRKRRGKVLRQSSERWQDHPSLWIAKGSPFSFTAEPYQLGLDDLRSIVSTADEHGLDVLVTTDSMHFPSRTLLVELKTSSREAS